LPSEDNASESGVGSSSSASTLIMQSP
jgi:hypothetical protein